MSRNVRNFWVELSVDGKRTDVATGPRGKDGGISIRIKMRNNGYVQEVLAIHGFTHGDGRLELTARQVLVPLETASSEIVITTKR